jgi:hypothetical protein
LYGGETASDGVLMVSFMPDPPVSLIARRPRGHASVERAIITTRTTTDSGRHHVIASSARRASSGRRRHVSDPQPGLEALSWLEAAQSVLAGNTDM